MVKTPVMLYKTLVIGIIIMFIGMSIVSSTGTIVQDLSAYHNSIESADISEEISSSGTTVYYFIAYGGSSGYPEGFYAQGPGDIRWSREWEGDDFFSGGTWTNDGRLLCCMYENGTLYDIDPKTLEACAIGDGGVSLNSLAYDPVYEKLYGASCSDLYEIDMNTGEQIYIGSFGIGTCMIGIACDIDGVCYGWDVLFSGSSTLFEINLETGEATEVFSLGEPLCYAQDGSFDYETDTLYLAAYYSTGFLAYVDFDAEELIHITNFEGGAEISVWVHSYELNMQPPDTTIYFEPITLDGEKEQYKGYLNVYLNATDNTGVIYTFYRINEGVWQTYESPFIISEYEEYKFEYYSYDYVGNFEEVKVFYYPGNFNPPYAPTIDGPKIGKPGIEYNYTFASCHPYGNDVYYLINWEDGTNSGWIGPYPSCQKVEISHEWSEQGTYNIRAKARDIHGAESDWSDPYEVEIENKPPNTPTIDGPTSGKIRVEYEYNFSLSDPNEDKMHLRIDWGSGTPSKWYGPYDSGTIVKLNHTWSKKGTYSIRAQTQDSNGLLSDWGTLTVNMPRTRATIYSLFQWFLERFPLLEKLLNLIRAV